MDDLPFLVIRQVLGEVFDFLVNFDVVDLPANVGSTLEMYRENNFVVDTVFNGLPVEVRPATVALFAVLVFGTCSELAQILESL